MATSGSVDFVATRADIIKDALQMIGGLGLGETPSSDQTTQASLKLNMIMKSWHSMGMPLWAMKFGYLLPVTDAQSATMGSGNVVTSYTHTTTSASSASGDSTITVTSTTGISSGYVIGVEQSTGDMQWTTVNGAPSGSTVTLTATLTGAVSSGAHVYVYPTTSRVTRPLKIYGAWRRHQDDTADTPLVVAERDTYMNLSDKDSEGLPVQYYYDPQLTGVIYWWPRFTDGDHLIVLSYQRPFEDFDADANDADCPQEWYLPLTWELAYNLAPYYGVPADERKMLRQESDFFFQKAKDFDQEEGSVRIFPGDRWR